MNAPQDLRNQALKLAANILEFSPQVKKGQGLKIATEILNDGRAWNRFWYICQAQGGIREIPTTNHQYKFLAQKNGVVNAVDNR